MSQLFTCGCRIEDHDDGPDIVYCNHHSGADKPHLPTFAEQLRAASVRGELSLLRAQCVTTIERIDRILNTS